MHRPARRRLYPNNPRHRLAAEGAIHPLRTEGPRLTTGEAPEKIVGQFESGWPPRTYRPRVRVGLPKKELARLNSARRRKRKARGEAVYLLAANSGRLIDLLVRTGKLRDGDIHTQEMIELALARWVLDEMN